jgi:hypothetical protein
VPKVVTTPLLLLQASNPHSEMESRQAKQRNLIRIVSPVLAWWGLRLVAA